jgi:hypothetical protein
MEIHTMNSYLPDEYEENVGMMRKINSHVLIA